MITNAAFEIESPKLTKHAFKVFRWMIALCALLLGLTGLSRASIIATGAQLDCGPYLRTTTNVKTMDGDGDNVYGTAGYEFFAVSSIGTGAGNGSGPWPGANVAALPAFVSSLTPAPGTDVPYDPNIQYNYGAGMAQIDNPASTPGSSVPKVLAGLAIARTYGTAPIATITLSTTAPIPAHFRIGIMTDNSGGIYDVPGQIQIKGTYGSNIETSAISAVALGNLNPDMYFFDVVNGQPGEVYTVYLTWGGQLPDGSVRYSQPGIGGITFDVTPTAPPTLATLLNTANQTLFDDFLGSSLNTDIWTPSMRFQHINGATELEAYRPGNVTVAAGFCTITQKAENPPVQNINMYGPDNGTTYPYSSGALQTYGKFTQTYGYFEAKIRASTGKGTWPAFWLLPDRGPSSVNDDVRTATGTTYNGYTFPMGNEIDVLEYMNNFKNPSTGLSSGHSGVIWDYNLLGYSFGGFNDLGQLVSPDTQFHTYGVMWSPNKLDCYIDGTLVMTGTSPNIAVCPSYMILNCAISKSNWSGYGAPSDADILGSLPATMDIDYVKVYSLPGTGGGSTTNLALNKTAVASSLESSGFPAANAVDSDTTGTRWSSSFSDPQWIYVDLGAVYSINRVKLGWEAAYAQAYQIQVSNDAATWTTIYNTTTGTGGINDLTGLSGSGRYVRMYGTQRGTYFGYSLWDFEVFGSAGSSATPMAVANAGFESGVTGSSPSGWQTLSATGYGADAWVVDNANDPGHNFSVPLPGTAEGTHYLNLAGYGTTGLEVIYQDITNNGLGNGALQPNTTYTLTVAVGEDLYSSPNNGFISLINGTDPTSGATLQTTQMSTLSFGNYANNFKDLSVTFTTPAVITGAGHLTIAIGTQYGWPNYGYVSIDNIRLTKH